MNQRSRFSKLAAAALIGAVPVSALAQTALGRAVTPGVVIGRAPARPSATPPGVLPNSPALFAASMLAAPPAVVAPAPKASAAERIKDAAAALDKMADLDSASGAQARDAGIALESALTGEGSAVASAEFDASLLGVPGGPSAELVALVKAKSVIIRGVRDEVAKVMVGQLELVDSIITAMIASEHVLIEGNPGVGKTVAVKAFSDAVEGEFQRVQGTPDKLPSDLLGAEILQEDPKTGLKAIVLEKGPVFTNILLADELNRMTPKAQAALLEAMAEGRVTIGRETLVLPRPFMVLATQNPIEQEGVYPLPEAQQDRFMYKVLVSRPTKNELGEIMNRFSNKDGQPKASKITSLDEMVEIRKVAEQVYVAESIKDYIVDLVEATHDPAKYGIAAEGLIESGASPRAGIFLLKAAKIQALMEGRASVGTGDVRAVATRVLRHRLTLSHRAGDTTTDKVIEIILSKVAVPHPHAHAAATLAPSDRVR